MRSVRTGAGPTSIEEGFTSATKSDDTADARVQEHGGEGEETHFYIKYEILYFPVLIN